MLFRFYDPRVFRDFLPTCTPKEAIAFMGPITTWWVESEDSSKLLGFRIWKDAVRCESVPLSTPAAQVTGLAHLAS